MQTLPRPFVRSSVRPVAQNIKLQMAKILADEGQATAASFICAAFPGRNSRSGRGQLVSPDGER